jgi:chromosomal replication initiation ATPase DnaA
MTTAQFDTFVRAAAFVSIRCGVPLRVLDSTTRRAPVMFARNVLIHILRHQAALTLQEIGLLMKRNHGAIYNSLRALENEVQTNCARASEVAALISEFTARSTARKSYIVNRKSP